MKRIIDFDPFTGVTDVFEYDYLTDVTTVSRHQDVEPILEQNKFLQNDESYTKKGIKNEFWHYASLPTVIIEKWHRELNIDVFNKNDERKVFQLLNSPEYRYLKTTHKYHS